MAIFSLFPPVPLSCRSLVYCYKLFSIINIVVFNINFLRILPIYFTLGYGPCEVSEHKTSLQILQFVYKTLKLGWYAGSPVGIKNVSRRVVVHYKHRISISSIVFHFTSTRHVPQNALNFYDYLLD